jgi:protein-tyrosine phosphatase
MQPDRLREVALADVVPGRLYLSEMPGRGGSLEEYERELAGKGVGRVLCLTPPDEVREKSPGYARKLEEGTFAWPVDRFPIPDYGVPEDIGGLVETAREAARRLRAGERLLIHCGAGVGRTGLVAACILLALGLSPAEAVRRVKEAGSRPETAKQRTLLEEFPRHLMGK